MLHVNRLRRLTLLIVGLGFWCALAVYAMADNGVLALEVAARRGDLATVQRLVQDGIDPSTRDINGSTAVHSAAAGGHLEVLTFLLNNGGEPDSADKQGRRPLYEAASSGSLECCRLLLARGAALDLPSVGGLTPLAAALHWGSDEATAYLVGLGANLQLSDGQSALMVAARRGYLGTVRELLSRGEKPETVDDTGKTALHHAVLGDNPDILTTLMRRGLSPEQPDKDGVTPLQIAARRSGLACIKRMLPTVEEAANALPDACAAGSPETVELLLGATLGAFPERCLEIAAGRAEYADACGILKLLLSRARAQGAVIEAAAGVGNQEAVLILLEAGVPATKESAHAAAQSVRPEILETLLEAGAPPPDIEQVRDAWRARRESLTATIERYSSMRRPHPEGLRAGYELERLESGREAVEALLVKR